MRIDRMIAAIAAVVALAAPAAGQQGPEQRIRQTLDRARASGLPVQLLESKVAEGRAKNVPLERIALVLEQRAVALGRAQSVLTRAVGPRGIAAEDIAMAADALQAGVQEQAVAEVATAAEGRRRAVAIAALTQLVANGVVAEEALRQVRGAMARGNEALMNLPATARGRPDHAGPPAGVPAAGRRAGTGRPPHAGPPEDRPGGKRPDRGPPGAGASRSGPPGAA